MKKLAFLPMLLLVFGVAGCEDDPPTQPTPGVPTFAMSLLSSNEVPPIQGAEASCAGTVTIRFNITRDAAQAITAATADFQATVTGCPSSTVITLAHIHPGAAGTTGGVLVNTGLASGEVGSNGSFTKNGINMTPQVAQQILDNPAGHYFNVHSQANGSGVIRAQLVRTN